MLICQQCGAESPQRNKFCLRCGADMKHGLVAITPRLTLASADARSAHDLEPTTSLGRHPSNSIQLLDKIVSKHHCVIERRGEVYVMRDLNSFNGTYVNGERVQGEVVLKDQDEIAVGSTFLRFETTNRRGSLGVGKAIALDSFGPPPPAAAAPAPKSPAFGVPPPAPAEVGAPPPMAWPSTSVTRSGMASLARDATGTQRFGSSDATRDGDDNQTSVAVSAVSPESVAPGSEFLLDIVLHLSSYDIEAATGLIAEHDLGTLQLRQGAQLDVVVCLDERQAEAFTIDEPEARVCWQPPWSRISFRFKTRQEAPIGTSYIRVEVGAGGVRLCHFYVEGRVEHSAKATPRKRYSVLKKIPRTAFASYASADRRAVCERLESIQSLGIDVFLDCLDIRQGENWQQILDEAVISKDAFLLFWSTAASRSPWVAREWQCALKARGLGYIVPNALEATDICPPPPPLAALHFGSRFAIP
jgi:hypothetical protein